MFTTRQDRKLVNEIILRIYTEKKEEKEQTQHDECRNFCNEKSEFDELIDL